MTRVSPETTSDQAPLSSAIGLIAALKHLTRRFAGSRKIQRRATRSVDISDRLRADIGLPPVESSKRFWDLL